MHRIKNTKRNIYTNISSNENSSICALISLNAPLWQKFKVFVWDHHYSHSLSAKCVMQFALRKEYTKLKHIRVFFKEIVHFPFETTSHIDVAINCIDFLLCRAYGKECMLWWLWWCLVTVQQSQQLRFPTEHQANILGQTNMNYRYGICFIHCE